MSRLAVVLSFAISEPSTRTAPDGRRDQACDHFERRAFARAVVSDDADDLTLAQLQIERVHGEQIRRIVL